MSRWLRYALTYVGVTTATALALLWWLYGGDLGAAVEPMVAQWNADSLAEDAGIREPTPTRD